MSDNKKYYYIKLKDSYFDKDNIKIIEAQENGYIYSLIILKLYLKSAKYEGRLMMTEAIPYAPEDVDIIAKVINHDVSHVRDAIQIALKFDLISIMDTGEIWMNDIQNFIGESSTEADRIREYRKRLSKSCTNVQALESTNVQHKTDKATPELEKEIDIKKELDLSPVSEKSTALTPTAEPTGSVKKSLSKMKDPLAQHYQSIITRIQPDSTWSDYGKERQQLNTLAKKTDNFFNSGVPYEDKYQTADAIVSMFVKLKQSGFWKADKPVIPSSISNTWAEIIDKLIQQHVSDERYNNRSMEDIPF